MKSNKIVLPQNLTIEPIGYFHCAKTNSYETPSQGFLDESNEKGRIELLEGRSLEQALRGLHGMSHLWVLFWFHEIKEWHPLVSPPRGSTQKQGLFATRSPHRPNPIGMSLVEIDSIDNRDIFIKKFDLLDGTPILDLKPYHPLADVAVNPRLGWMENLGLTEYKIMTSTVFDHQAQFLFEKGVTQLPIFCSQQLRFEPFNSKKKRVALYGKNAGVLSYRTWRIHFTFEGTLIRLEKITSGYNLQDLAEDADKWGDKPLHRTFKQTFGA